MIASLVKLIVDQRLTWRWSVFIILIDFALCLLIVAKVKYTEIDWIAYMQEVQGYEDGERNYLNLKGDTGPLVYPAGFLYVFSLLKYLTNNGLNIPVAQYIFVGIYLVNELIVLGIYIKGEVPLCLSFVLVLSKRIHSIFMLRLFNDTIAMLLVYIAVFLFMNKQYRVECLVYSTSVSIKMNTLLCAPGILIILLLDTTLYETILCLSICAITQLIIGYEFLTTYPVEYLTKAFEIGRVFTYKWTVNYKFLSEDIFISKRLSLFLLVCTLFGYIALSYKVYRQTQTERKDASSLTNKLTRSTFITSTIFTSNVIGIVFARSLHYQFYSWYYHMIPFLLYHTNLYSFIQCLVLICIEICYNIFPSTSTSSLCLQMCHAVILIAVLMSPIRVYEGTQDEKKHTDKQD